jgi:hypothetical protein
LHTLFALVYSLLEERMSLLQLPLLRSKISELLIEILCLDHMLVIKLFLLRLLQVAKVWVHRPRLARMLALSAVLVAVERRVAVEASVQSSSVPTDLPAPGSHRPVCLGVAAHLALADVVAKLAVGDEAEVALV